MNEKANLKEALVFQPSGFLQGKNNTNEQKPLHSLPLNHMFTWHFFGCWQGTLISIKLAIEGFKFPLSNLASQLHLWKTEHEKKVEPESFFSLIAFKSRILVSKFRRPIQKDKQNNYSELSVAFIEAFNLANSLQAEVPGFLRVMVKRFCVRFE